ncbi:MAG TPA: hypothetical protein VLG76_07550 [Rhabdochlamydiaceae bacterium]|nr:hypothetical protein [Rhabdochlamydiaceae bacterium]
MSDETLKENTHADLEHEINFIKYGSKMLTFVIYTRLCQLDRHFESITTKYKYIALTWLLATYAGIGYLLSGKLPNLLFDDLVVVAIICFIGIVGITLIWHLDINVYQRFWFALFAEEVIIEEKNPFLLQTKRAMLLIDKSKEKLFSQGLLYLIADILLIITAGVAIFSLSKNKLLHIKIIILACVGSFLFLLAFYMIRNMIRLQKNLHELIEFRRKKKRYHLKQIKG